MGKRGKYTKHNPVNCPVCGVEIMNRGSLRYHVLTHTDAYAEAERILAQLPPPGEETTLTLEELQQWATR